MAKLDSVCNTWDQIISSIANLPANNTIWSVIQRLVLGASVYYIWQERNVRLFSSFGRSEDVLFKTTDVINAAKVWSFPIDNRLRYKYFLDELLDDNMGINDDN